MKNKGRSCAAEPLPPSPGTSVTFPECPVTLGPICSISVIICSGTSRAELQEGEGSIPPVGKADGRTAGKHSAQVPWEGRRERVGIQGAGGDSPLPALLAGRPPIACAPLGLYLTLQGSDLDKRFCPQLLLTGLGGMRGNHRGRQRHMQTLGVGWGEGLQPLQAPREFGSCWQRGSPRDGTYEKPVCWEQKKRQLLEGS